ncbi:MAG TPA: neutral/alkaline non-lysosomal ceramidase N-terminal domain-containing protein [Membranihabitans sp.]|nr:neutral/alkaline non-lysosomal ceramidase N-terminal domain-containing protein [Membranihabitans sp.]
MTRIQKTLQAFAILFTAFGFSFVPKITAQQTTPLIEVGIASADITPEMPIRLGGYGARSKSETVKVMHRLEAKALVFGRDNEDPAVFITLDLVGLSDYMTSQILEGLKEKWDLDPARVAMSASHTHGAPEVGNIINILQYRGATFSDSLLSVDELEHITQYNDQVVGAVLETVGQAFANREPSIVAWGQGQALFAKNRRPQGGPIDPALPMMRITRPGGELRGILVNYACHGTTLSGAVNEIHGDWMSEAKINIEKRHPGAIAMVAIGCGGDANPNPRGSVENMKTHGSTIADEVDKLLTAQLDTLFQVPDCRIKRVDLPFEEIPTTEKLMQLAKNDQTIKGYYARLAMERILRGQPIPESLSYPVQVWAFGDQMAMVNLAGEVVVDYSYRIKESLGAELMWVNGYMNEVPCYIASERVIKEGGYEAESSMYYYDKPSPFSTEVEDIIVEAVHELMPANLKQERPETNRLKTVSADPDGRYILHAMDAATTGPNIKYMPEWKAFGWFNTEDEARWEVQVDQPGKYKAFLEWTVDDARSGKTFLLEGEKNKVKGTIGKTGSWFTFRTEMIGTIRLKSGLNNLTFKSGNKKEEGAMLDLRKIVLVPE